MGNAFLAEKKLSFIMKLFHFVCEKRLLDWLLGSFIEYDRSINQSDRKKSTGYVVNKRCFITKIH
jgi:hypothetical protein